MPNMRLVLLHRSMDIAVMERSILGAEGDTDFH